MRSEIRQRPITIGLSCSCCRIGVTVLSAVGSLRRNIWFEVRALQCPQRARILCYATQGPLTQSARTLAPSGNYPPASAGRDLVRQADAGCSVQRNGSPEHHMRCKMTESFRANATRALPTPDRLAIASAQSFRPEARFTLVISTTAASYISVRASVSPHFDILPARSISPD